MILKVALYQRVSSSGVFCPCDLVFVPCKVGMCRDVSKHSGTPRAHASSLTILLLTYETGPDVRLLDRSSPGPAIDRPGARVTRRSLRSPRERRKRDAGNQEILCWA